MHFPSAHPPDDPLRRYIVAFCSVSVGVIAGVFDHVVAVSFRPQQLQHLGGKIPDIDSDIGLSFCVTLFAVSYFVGKMIYRRMGASNDLAELTFWSSGHMVVLNAPLGVVLLFISASELWQNGVFRPALPVAVCMLVSAVRDAHDFLRYRKEALSLLRKQSLQPQRSADPKPDLDR